MFYCKFRGRLVHVFKHMFSVFKQHFMHFHTSFHPHITPKNINNATKWPLTFYLVLVLKEKIIEVKKSYYYKNIIRKLK